MNAPIDARAFRTSLGAFATGVTIVTTRGPKGAPIGNTVNSFSALSLDPPLVLWSFGKRAYSFKSYLSTDHFAVNILREGQEEFSRRFSRSLDDKWNGLDYETWDTGCPHPAQCPRRRRMQDGLYLSGRRPCHLCRRGHQFRP